MNTHNKQEELRHKAHIIMNADTPYDAQMFLKDAINSEVTSVLDELEEKKLLSTETVQEVETGKRFDIPLEVIQSIRSRYE